jgi:hypothetical protein
MNISIKMIGIATVILWLFLIIFSVFAASSIRDVQFNSGNPQLTLLGGDQLQISVPLSIGNRGKYEMRQFNLTSVLRDSANRIITRSFTLIEAISPGQTVNKDHTIMFNITDVLENDRNLLFNDSQMVLCEYVGLTLAGLIPVSAMTNVSVPWGAPFYNLTIGNPQYSSFNATHILATVPISFENHAQFGFQGTLQTAMHSNSNVLVTQSQTNFTVAQNSIYHGNMNLYLPLSPVSQSSHLEVRILTPFLNFGPVVVSYG